MVSCKDLKVRGKNWTGNKLESHSDMDGNKNYSYEGKRLEEKHGDEILLTTYFVNNFIGIQLCTLVYLLSMAAFNMIAANWSSCDKSYIAHKVENTYYLVPYGKSLLILDLQ